jgi:tetratricopeptide (TPR) repeat protein
MKQLSIIFLAVLFASFASIALGAQEKQYQTLYRQGVEQNKKGNVKGAIDFYSKAIANKSDSPELYFVRGRAYRQNEQYDESLRDFDKAIALKPNYAEAYSQRGVLYIGRGDQGKARADFKKSCDLGYSDGCANLKKLNASRRMP